MSQIFEQVPGALELINWFGYWPSFHDAEVLSLDLQRTGPSRVSVHTFELTSQTTTQGSFACTKHVVVTFVLEDVSGLRLDDFNSQNVVAGLVLRQTAEGYELEIEGSHGLQGTITAGRIHVEIEPGIPLDSQYQKV